MKTGRIMVVVLFYAGLNGAVFVISGWRELIRVLIISMGAGLGMAVGQAVRKPNSR